MATTGTYTIADLLSNADAAEARVFEFGYEALVQPLEDALAAHNTQVNGMMSDLVAETTERTGTYGVEQDAEMIEADEFSRAPTQKAAARGKVGYPLSKRQFALGWTNDYFIRATVRDMIEKQILAQRAHVKALRNGIRNALFGATNYNATERFVTTAYGETLPVKRLVNADGDPIPSNSNTLTFDGATHTHYDATASVSGAGLNTALVALVDDVVEHDHGGAMRLYINRAQETAVRALSSFAPFLEARVIPGAGVTTSRAEGTLDMSRLDNRAIGLFHGAEVWTKPWMPADYFFTFDASDARKPLRMRVPVEQQLRGLRRAAELHTFPLHAQYMEALFGFGAWTRTNGAVLYANADNGGTYTAPTFT
jgi:hypothetical protein